MILDVHSVRGDVPPRRVEIALAHDQGVEPPSDRDRVHHPLREQHPLRPAEAAERGVRHRIGAHPPGMDPRRRVVVGVVGVEHGPIVHAERKIGRVAAAGVELDINPPEHPFAVEATAPVDAEVMTLAGHHHVVVAIETKLGRAAGHAGREGGEARPLRRLRLLAAERPAHPPALTHHRRMRRPEHAGDEVLHLGRMLGGGVDPHLVVLAGDGESRLSLEIEVFLAADAHVTFEPARGGGDRGRRLPAPELVGGQHLGGGGQTIVHGDAGSNRIDFDAGAPRRAAGLVAGLGDHREDDLSVKENLAAGEDWVVAECGAAIIRTGDVCGCQHCQHSGGGAHRVEVDRADRAACGAGMAGRDVHRACRLGQVVDVGGGPLHVARGAVVGEGETDTRACTEARPVRERDVGDRRANPGAHAAAPVSRVPETWVPLNRVGTRPNTRLRRPRPREQLSVPGARHGSLEQKSSNIFRNMGVPAGFVDSRVERPDSTPSTTMGMRMHPGGSKCFSLRTIRGDRRGGRAAPPRCRSRSARQRRRPACRRSALRRRRPRPRPGREPPRSA